MGATESAEAAAAAAVEALPPPLPNGRPLFAAGGAEPPDPPPCLPISLFCISLHLCFPRKTEREASLKSNGLTFNAQILKSNGLFSKQDSGPFF